MSAYQTSVDPRTVSIASSSPSSSVSWPAIFAGALVLAASSLVLLILGSGLGLAIVSPWATAGVGATTFAVSTAIWLIVTQWPSAGLGGYVTGRMRTRFLGVHPHEVFFRDTAHGVLTWALATLIVAGMMGVTVSAIIDRGTSAVVSVAGGAAQSAVGDKANNGAFMPSAYMIDMMFRPVTSTAPGNEAAPQLPANADALKAEATNIIGASLVSGQMTDADQAQLASIISQRTGMTQADAEQRVSDTIASINAAKVKVQEAADATRKAGLMLSLMTCLSLIIGAFVASVAAAYGGAQRDDAEIARDDVLMRTSSEPVR